VILIDLFIVIMLLCNLPLAPSNV